MSMATWKFQFIESDDDYSFTIDASDVNEAFDKAHNGYGPQVDDMVANIINE